MAVLGEREVGHRLGLPEDTVRERLAAARERLRAARASRPPPADRKLIAAWNGLALQSLARAEGLPGGVRYREAGRRLARLLAERFWDGRRLARAIIDGRPQGEAAVEDYAYVATGLAAWAQASGDGQVEALAARIAEQAWARFRGGGGWRLAPAGVLPFGGAEVVLPDGPMPSPSALLLRLAQQGPDPGLAAQARAVLGLAYPELGEAPLRHATHIALLKPGPQHTPRDCGGPRPPRRAAPRRAGRDTLAARAPGWTYRQAPGEAACARHGVRGHLGAPAQAWGPVG
jgi:uncharacterized protein YyaL (SSP411 family)